MQAAPCPCSQMHRQLAKEKKKRKEKTTPFGVNLMRSPVLYRAAQELAKDSDHKLLFLKQSILQAMQTLSRTSKGCLVNKLKHQKGPDSAAANMFDTKRKNVAECCQHDFSISLPSVHAQQAQGLHEHIVSGHQDTDKCSCLGFSG